MGYKINFSEIISGRRFDAQCYKPELSNYEFYLRENERFSYLHSLVRMTKGKQMVVSSIGDIGYGSIKDIDGVELIADDFCELSEDTRIANRQDLLLAVTGATIGKVGIVERYDELAHSGDLLALKTKGEINPYYLLVVLESPIGQSQCQRWITGSTNGHLSPTDVAKFVIPRIDKPLEEEIANIVRASLNAKRKSEEILEQAKVRVEELIEETVQ